MNERTRTSMCFLVMGPVYKSTSFWFVLLLLANVLGSIYSTLIAAERHPAASAIVHDGMVAILVFLVAGIAFLWSDLRKFRELARAEENEVLRELLFESAYRVVIMSVMALGLLYFALSLCGDLI